MGVANNPEIRQATRCGDIKNGKRQARIEVREIREIKLIQTFSGLSDITFPGVTVESTAQVRYQKLCLELQ
jgi:hypothetical protein